MGVGGGWGGGWSGGPIAWPAAPAAATAPFIHSRRASLSTSRAAPFRQVATNLLRSLNNLRIPFDHEVEEDEMMLEAGKLSSRGQLAVRNRRLTKILLDQQQDQLAAQLDGAQKKQHQTRQAAPDAPYGEAGRVTPEPKPPKPTKYNTGKQRKREEEKRRLKEEKKEAIRKLRAEMRDSVRVAMEERGTRIRDEKDQGEGHEIPRV